METNNEIGYTIIQSSNELNLQLEYESIKKRLNTNENSKLYVTDINEIIKILLQTRSNKIFKYYYIFKLNIITKEIIGYLNYLNPYKRLNKELKWKQLSL